MNLTKVRRKVQREGADPPPATHRGPATGVAGVPMLRPLELEPLGPLLLGSLPLGPLGPLELELLGPLGPLALRPPSMLGPPALGPLGPLTLRPTPPCWDSGAGTPGTSGAGTPGAGTPDAPPTSGPPLESCGVMPPWPSVLKAEVFLFSLLCANGCPRPQP